MIVTFIKRATLLLLIAPAALLAKPPVEAAKRNPTPQPDQAEPAPVQARPALWKVADADTTIYLFGTLHIMPEKIAWFDGKVADAFAASQELVTELPALEPDTLQAVTQRYALLPKGQNLRDKLSPAQRKTYEAALAKMAMPPAALDRMKPWYAAVVFTLTPLRQQGFNVANGVDKQLADKAKALGKGRIGLETAEAQMSIFSGLPQKVQVRYLMETIAQQDTAGRQINALIKAWAAGDADQLSKLTVQEQSDRMMYQALFTNRNRNWARWIKGRLARPGTAMVAVGAGHLAGRSSVQAMLSKSGIRVTRVQ